MALKRKHSSCVQVYDFHQSTSPKSSSTAAEKHLPVSAADENEMPVRKRMRPESFEKLLSLKSIKWSSSSNQAAEDFPTGQKRKRSSLSVHDISSLNSCTDAAEQHLPVSAGGEHEMSVKKKRRTDSFESLLSPKYSSSDQASRHERQAGDHPPESIAWSHEDHGFQKPLSSDPEVLPPADQQVQSPPAPVHHSPASAHSSIVDLTTENDILSRYEIVRKLGEGGFGSVYEGKRLEDGLEVAVKIARKPKNMKYINISGHPTPLPLEVGLLILANREPKAPEIIQLLDWQDQPEYYIIVMERPSPCEELWDYLRRHGGILKEETARFIMAQVTMAAHICCQRGVFHCDIKLENLLINPDQPADLPFSRVKSSPQAHETTSLLSTPCGACTTGDRLLCGLWECSYSSWCVDASHNQKT